MSSVPVATDSGEDQRTNPAWDGVWALEVRTPQGRTRRRVVLSLLAAQVAVERARAGGQRARVVLCQLRPILDVTSPEPSVVEVALRAAGFTVTDDDGTPLNGRPW